MANMNTKSGLGKTSGVASVRALDGGIRGGPVCRQSWQARWTADILRVTAKVSLRAAARTRADTGRALLVIRRMADFAAPLFQRLPPHAQVVPADCDGVSGEWVRAGTGLDESKVVLIFHGGGYFSLSAAAVRPLTWRLSEAARRPVLAIDYALAPENDLPAARADALTTYRWLLADGFRPEDITLAGDSTGGHLALATLLAVRDEGLPLPAAVVAVSPWADLTPDGPRHRGNAGTDAFFPPRFLPWLARCYTRGCDPSDPLISPVNGDYAGTPPMMLVCSDAEALRDDARRVAERARDAGVRVRYDEWPGQVHDFPAFAGLIPEGRQAIIRIGAFLLETDSVGGSAS